MTTYYEILRAMVSDKAFELFADYGVGCALIDAAPPEQRQLCGILGFTGEHLCGSIVISATHEAIAGSNPIGDGATRGWVAELTNQLVGRFKNALFRRGIEVAMSIPVVLTATQLTPLPQGELAPVWLSVGEGQLTIWLEIEPSESFALAEPSVDSEIAAEGEAMLF